VPPQDRRSMTRPIRRVVTGHNADGKSIFIIEDQSPRSNRTDKPCTVAFVLIDAEPV
jgi:hypothetical protein